MLHKNDVLTKIIDERKLLIAKTGTSFGIPVPDTRTRPVVPFLSSKGVILEIKRASPSKGAIAPTLDAAKTAQEYALAGAAAISVLTEQNFFKGNLTDLQETVRTIDFYNAAHPHIQPVAVLRKDFLITPEEIDISFRCGADAVLLIARILEQETLIQMAHRCEELGMTALIELREDEDLCKLSHVLETVSPGFIVCGINARDLSDFTIDPLIPAAEKAKVQTIHPQLRIVYESGIQTCQGAAFAASMGFTGILLGEFAARDPASSKKLVEAFTGMPETYSGKSWVKLAATIKKINSTNRPAIKICGITREKDALAACDLGADFLGFIFSTASARQVQASFVRTVHQVFVNKTADKRPQLVGVITDPSSPEATAAFSLIKDGILDYIQYHDCPIPTITDSQSWEIPCFAAIRMETDADLERATDLLKDGTPRILIDRKDGKPIPCELLEHLSNVTKLWIAGGLSTETAETVLKTYHPELIDISSSIETSPGIKDIDKMKIFFNTVFKTTIKKRSSV